MIIDLLNMMLRMDPNKLAGDNLLNGGLNIEEMRTRAIESLGNLSIGEFRYSFKTFKNVSLQNLITSKITDTLFTSITKMRENKVGHLIAVEKDLSNVVAIVSKRDFLLFMIRNFTMSEHYDKILRKPILEIEIGVSGSNIFQMDSSQTLRTVYQEMNIRKLSCIPIKGNNNEYLGVIQKWHIYEIFKKLLFHYLDKEVREFLEYMKASNDPNKVNSVAYIDKNDLFSDVLQKFVFSKG